MGFAEVIKNLGTIFRNFRFCKRDILNYQPDVVILIDYPGFNLRMAQWAKENHFKVVYYISPQVWAWKENRVNSIKKYVDKMLVILPFEKDFYQTWDYQVEYIGHPLVQVVEDALNQPQSNPLELSPINQHNVVALLPGSREQEIAKKLPVMLEASKSFPDYTFIVAKASSLPDEYYNHFLTSYPQVRSIRNRTYQLLMQAKAALVTSGTATLETALFGVPEVVCYKGSAVSYQIAKRLVKIKFISLVNLIMDKEVVKELIQGELTVSNLVRELRDLLENTERKRQIQIDYVALKKLLSKGGHASANAAKIIYQFVQNKSSLPEYKLEQHNQ
jgi:lipid-A-disaccharide synthase